MSELPTVKIVTASKSGYANINESDFDPEVHELFLTEEEKAAAEKAAADKAAADKAAADKPAAKAGNK